MKTILAWALVCLLAGNTFAQGVAVRSLGGISTNLFNHSVLTSTDDVNHVTAFLSNGVVSATGSGFSTFIGSMNVNNQFYCHNLQADDCDFNGNLHGGAGTFSFATTNNGFGNLSANALAFNLFTFNQDAIGNFWFEDFAHAIPLMWATNDGTYLGFKKVFIGPNTTNNPAAGKTLHVGGDVQFDGSLVVPKTVSSTTGIQTINKMSGSILFAAAVQSIIVTDSLVDTNSIIIATVYDDDTTAKSCIAKGAAGQFTLKLNAAATAQTRVNFLITN